MSAKEVVTKTEILLSTAVADIFGIFAKIPRFEVILNFVISVVCSETPQYDIDEVTEYYHYHYHYHKHRKLTLPWKPHTSSTSHPKCTSAAHNST